MTTPFWTKYVNYKQRNRNDFRHLATSLASSLGLVRASLVHTCATGGSLAWIPMPSRTPRLALCWRSHLPHGGSGWGPVTHGRVLGDGQGGSEHGKGIEENHFLLAKNKILFCEKRAPESWMAALLTDSSRSWEKKVTTIGPGSEAVATASQGVLLLHCLLFHMQLREAQTYQGTPGSQVPRKEKGHRQVWFSFHSSWSLKSHNHSKTFACVFSLSKAFKLLNSLLNFWFLSFLTAVI